MPQYYQTNTVSYSPSQDGHINPLFGVWTEGGTEILMDHTIPTYAGVCFQLLSQFDPERGLPLDPPNFLSFMLNLTRTSAIEFGTVAVSYVNDTTPDLFGAGNLPNPATATFLGRITVGASNALSFTLSATTMRALVTQPSWRGRLAFVLEWNPDDFGSLITLSLASSENATAASRPSLTTTQIPFTTGIQTPEIDRPGRIRTCSRSGVLAFADEFVRDGYVEGLWVHHGSYDPPDRSDEYHLPPSEGQIHDEVP